MRTSDQISVDIDLLVERLAAELRHIPRDHIQACIQGSRSHELNTLVTGLFAYDRTLGETIQPLPGLQGELSGRVPAVDAALEACHELHLRHEQIHLRLQGHAAARPVAGGIAAHTRWAGRQSSLEQSLQQAQQRIQEAQSRVDAAITQHYEALPRLREQVAVLQEQHAALLDIRQATLTISAEDISCGEAFIQDSLPAVRSSDARLLERHPGETHTELHIPSVGEQALPRTIQFFGRAHPGENAVIATSLIMQALDRDPDTLASLRSCAITLLHALGVERQARSLASTAIADCLSFLTDALQGKFGLSVRFQNDATLDMQLNVNPDMQRAHPHLTGFKTSIVTPQGTQEHFILPPSQKELKLQNFRSCSLPEVVFEYPLRGGYGLRCTLGNSWYCLPEAHTRLPPTQAPVDSLTLAFQAFRAAPPISS